MTASVHQLLFGYLDGHRLRASSTQLDRPTSRQLLAHGDVAVSGARRRLTSMSLPAHGAWAFTATWRDELSPRPGSVWSHTLWLAADALAEPFWAPALLDLFKKPQPGDSSFDGYRRPLPLPSDAPAHTRLDARLAQDVAAVWFGRPNESTTLLVDDVEGLGERELLAVWGQQWPKLRQMTSFATRPQADPVSSQALVLAHRRTRGAGAERNIIERNRLPVEPPPWLKAMALNSAKPGDLHRFLWTYGPQAPSDRASAGTLTRLYLALHAGKPNAFEGLIKAYPQSESMRRLKTSSLQVDATEWPAPELLRLRCAVDHFDHVDLPDRELARRLVTLARGSDDASGVVPLLVKAWQRHPDVGSSVVSLAAASEDAVLLRAVAEERSEMAQAIVREQPGLLVQPPLWRAPASWQPALLRLALPDQSGALARLLAGAGRDDLLARALTDQSLRASDVLEAVSGDRVDDQMVERLGVIFTNATAALIEAAGRGHASARQRAAVLALQPGSVSVLGRPSAPLLDVADRAGGALQSSVYAAVLADALATRRELDLVMKRAFPVVHRALVEQRLSEAAWKQLDGALPHRGSWDRAERLRVALLDVIKAYHWNERDVAALVRRAGPEAQRLRQLTDRKSDIRKLIDSVGDLLGL